MITPAITPKRRRTSHRLALAIGDTIRAARTKRGLTMEALGKKVGVVRTYVCKVETGSTLPRYDQLMRFAAALDTTAWNLVRNAEARMEKAKGEQV